MSSFSTNVVHRAACPLAWTSRWTMNPLFAWQLSEFHKWQNQWGISSSPMQPYLSISEFLAAFSLFFPHPSSISPPVCQGQDSRNAFPQFILPSSATQHFAAFVLLLTILCPTTIPLKPINNTMMKMPPPSYTQPHQVLYFAPWGCTLWGVGLGHWRGSIYVECLESYSLGFNTS